MSSIVRPVIDLGTARMERLLELLDNPQKDSSHRVIHVTGTNGKGSTVEMIATGLWTLGKRVGVFTSPFVVHERDAIRVFHPSNAASRCITAQDWVLVHDLVNAAISENMRDDPLGIPTDFEVLFAAAMVYFHSLSLDFIVIEVGMGGRRDATNVFQINPCKVCVITGISLDHQAFLGNTVEAICEEKCGIITPGSTVIVNGDMVDDLLDIVDAHIAANPGSKLLLVNQRMCPEYIPFMEDDYEYTPSEVEMADVIEAGMPNILHIPPLNGDHQFLLSEIAIAVIRHCLPPGFPEQSIYDSIENTRLPGRIEIRFDYQYMPFSVILDGAHNIESAIGLRKFVDDEMENMEARQVIWILATSAGRENIVPTLIRGKSDICICVKFKSYQESTAAWIKPASPEALATIARESGSQRVVAIDGFIEDAIKYVTSTFDKSTLERSLVVVAGSLYFTRNYLRMIDPTNPAYCNSS